MLGDAVERIRSKHRLTQQSAILEATSDFVSYVDPDGKVLYINRAGRKMLGIGENEDLASIRIPEYQPAWATERLMNEGFPTAMNTGVWHGESAIIGADNEEIPVSQVLMAHKLKNGELDYYSTIMRDISELRKAEHEKEKLTDQLYESDKMASIGQLAAGVAHEINNPVGYIYSNLNTMNKYLWKVVKTIKESGALEDIHAELEDLLTDFGDAIAESLEGADRVRQIVSDLRSFSRADSGKIESVNIVRCIETSLNVVWNQLKYHCKVEKEYDDLLMVNCYPSKIDQVLVNLLVNAGQATQGKEGLIKITARVEGDDVIVSIRDNGVGIPEENLKAIFDPFFTTKDVGSGTGLGLSVSYGIVQEHGGRIEVDSKVGEGTEFRVILPLIQPVAKPEIATT